MALAFLVPSPSFAQSPPACPNAGDSPSDVGAQTAAAATLCLLNEVRAGQGLGALRANDQLTAAAQGHASDMVANHYFEHDSQDGRHFDDRIRATGYLASAERWWVGENLAWGTQQLATPQSIVDAWMNSPEHRANILDSDYSEIGIAIVTGAPTTDSSGPGATYVTDFGRIQPVAHVTRATHPAHRRRRSHAASSCPASRGERATAIEYRVGTASCVFR